MTRRSMYITLAFLCTTLVCCAPGLNLIHFHSKKPKATVVRLRGMVSHTWDSVLRKAFEDNKCKMVVACIESGGGSVLEVQLLEHRIRVLRAKYPKPFWVFSERILASGAYWLACLADTIVLAPPARCGSIGVTYSRVDSTKMDAARGITWHIFRSGPLKGMGNPHLPMTDPEYFVITSRISQVYMEFLNLFLHERGPSLTRAHDSLQTMVPMDISEFVMNITQGNVYDADVARAYGIADKVMWFDELLLHLHTAGFKVSTSQGLPVKNHYSTEISDSLVYDAVPIELLYNGIK